MTKTFKLMPIMEVVPGFALDLYGEDEKADSWEFTRSDVRAKARAFLFEEKPLLLIANHLARRSAAAKL